jgi:hypothetical protein
MMQSEKTNSRIETCAKEALAAIGRPDTHLTVWQISFAVPKESEAQYDASESAGTWEMRLSSRKVYTLSLTFKETYDSEELKAAIMRSIL